MCKLPEGLKPTGNFKFLMQIIMQKVKVEL